MLCRNLWLALVLTAHPTALAAPIVSGAPSAARSAGSDDPSASVSADLERVAVIGASASAGFMLPGDLGEALDLLITAPHERVLSLASSRFFANPEGYAVSQIAEAQRSKPTAVVALDFLFWFSYGAVPGERDRISRLERGLKFLESFECPVLTSTIPDMRAATGKMLWPRQVPTPETLSKLNERIEQWAISRSNVVLVSLPTWHAQLVAGEPFEISGKTWPRVPGAPLLQHDQLHPNVDGLALIACKVLESLVEAGLKIDPEGLALDPARVAEPLQGRLKSIVRRRY